MAAERRRGRKDDSCIGHVVENGGVEISHSLIHLALVHGVLTMCQKQIKSTEQKTSGRAAEVLKEQSVTWGRHIPSIFGSCGQAVCRLNTEGNSVGSK